MQQCFEGFAAVLTTVDTEEEEKLVRPITGTDEDGGAICLEVVYA